MSDTPNPLSPPDCDLRGYDFMPLFGRMFGSRFYSLALRNPRAGLAAIKLWWEAWQQCPAGSLPDDDFDLARMADFGTDMKTWKVVKETALHGFVKCSDGRLYHPILSREAILAWEKRKKDRERKAEQRRKAAEKSGGNGGGRPQDVPWDKPGTGRGPTGGYHAGQSGGCPMGQGMDGDAPFHADSDRDSDRDSSSVFCASREAPVITPVPTPTATSAKPKRAKPRTSISPAWWPSEAGLEFARERGVNVDVVVPRFRDYHLGKGNLMADWDAAWRTWCGNEGRFGKSPPPTTADIWDWARSPVPTPTEAPEYDLEATPDEHNDYAVRH